MNVESAVMTCDYSEARRRYLEYRTAAKGPHGQQEDVLLYKAYRALVRGQKVLDITTAIVTGGVDQLGRPHLAVCRADAPVVFLQIFGDGVRFSSRGNWRRRPAGDVMVPRSAFFRVGEWNTRACAVLPSIPPQFRPKAADVADYHLLWDAQWEPAPPTDPLLLKRLDGPFFVVVAAWNLTPLEQAVMRLRL